MLYGNSMNIAVKRNWTEGVVNPDGEHIVISYGKDYGDLTPVARLAPGPGRSFTVQFTLKPDPADEKRQRILAEIRADLDFHLAELHEPDPWAYARYHCHTAANAFSVIRWAFFHCSGYSEGQVESLPHTSS